MPVTQQKLPVPDSAFFANQEKFSSKELAKYYGQYVAWNLDGTCILASGEDPETVEQQLKSAGIDPAQAVRGYVPQPDVVLL